MDDPAPYLRVAKPDNVRNELEVKLLQELKTLASYVVTEINYYIEDHGGEAFDYKSVFKSERGVKLIRSEVLKAYEKDLYRDKVYPFQLPQAAAGAGSGSTAAAKKTAAKKGKKTTGK